VLERTAVLAAIVLGMAPAAGFGQAGPAVPPVEQGPDAGSGGPAVPEGQAPAPVYPLPPDVLPSPDAPLGTGGRDCEHERSPGIGV
jgi:hypothetical protein